MQETLHLLQLVLPVFLVIGAGYTMRRARILTEVADESLLGILVKLFVPCLALDVIIGNEALVRPANLFLPPLLGFALVALGIGISLIAAKCFLKGANVQRTFAATVGLQNYGYIPLPLCQLLFGREVVGVLFAFNLGVEFAMWSLVVATIAGRRSGQRWWDPLLNAPVLAVIAGIILNLLGAGKWIPEPLHNVWHMLGLCAVPLGILLTGAVLADHATSRVLQTGWPTISLAVVLRLGLLPILLIGIAFFLPVDGALKAVLVVQAAMPAAVFPIVLTKLHNGDMPTALRVVLITSLLGLITIPIWLAFGLSLIGFH